LVLFAGAERLPSWATGAWLALGALIVSLDIYFAGEIRTNDEMFYVLVSFYAFYYLTRRQAVAQLGIVAVLYAATLALRGEPDALDTVGDHDRDAGGLRSTDGAACDPARTPGRAVPGEQRGAAAVPRSTFAPRSRMPRSAWP